MPISVLQTNSAGVAGGNIITVGFLNLITLGSLIWVGTLQYALASGAGVSFVKDNINNVNFTLAASHPVTGGRDTGYIYYFPNSAAGAITITVQGNVNTTFAACTVMEIAGVSALDATASGDTSGGSSATVTSSAFSTALAAEILTAYPFNADGTNYSYTQQSGYTNVPAGPGSGMSDGAQYLVVSSKQTGVTSSMTANAAAATHGILVATFSVTAPPPPSSGAGSVQLYSPSKHAPNQFGSHIG